MQGLSPEGALLLRAVRSVLRPSLADRERVFAALTERLGKAAFVPSAQRTPLEPPRVRRRRSYSGESSRVAEN